MLRVVGVSVAQDSTRAVRLATFDLDVTPPLGSQMAYDPVKATGELPLRCRGLVILSADDPIVICSVDWLGIANDGFDAFRDAIALAAGTPRERVTVHTVHQHDAPGCDFTAERIIRELGGLELGRFEGTFHREVIDRLSTEIARVIQTPQSVTHMGWGVARVEDVASNRRILGPDGKVRITRYTTARDPAVRAEPVGTIDPEVSVLSFWDQERPLACVSFYACHPQSYYRTGIPSPDFPGIARFLRGQAVPSALHVHFNGAGGNIGAGKYNDGAKENRVKLALRLADGMKSAFEATEKTAIDSDDVGWNFVPVRLAPGKHLDKQQLIQSIRNQDTIGGYIDKADQLAYLQRFLDGHSVPVSCLTVGSSRCLFLPGELFVEYQLAAKQMRPDLNVAMAAYGDYGTGYIGTAESYGQGGYETSERATNVGPDAEAILMRAIKDLLEVEQPESGSESFEEHAGIQGENAGDGEDASPIPEAAMSPLAPEEALRSFEVPTGLEMQLVACEPNVIEPIVICYDETGNLFVAEYIKFPATGGKSDRPDGRIRKLVDQDGDGFYETARIFADQLAWPSGICPWNGGAFVISAPDLWYFKDNDGDGQAEIREKIFTGFGFRNEEGTANNLIWGLDGWIYGAGSNSGGLIRRAGQPNATTTSIRGCDFRFHPQTFEFEPLSGGEQFGNTFDDYGYRYLCQNSKPAVLVAFPLNKAERNPFLSVPTLTEPLYSDTTIFRKSKPEPWRVARTKLRMQERRNWAAPFVRHDVHTGTTGVTVYRGNQLPKQFKGNLFVGDVQGNLVHRRTLDYSGSIPNSFRADSGTEFLRSTDNWFRPVNFCNAPDGTLQIVDMYRGVVETPDSLPADILTQVDLNAGNDRGRIYRLAPVGMKAERDELRLNRSDWQSLVQALDHDNSWHRETASRLLFEQGEEIDSDQLAKSLRRVVSPLGQIHAAYLLRDIGKMASHDLARWLQSQHAIVRKHGVRLCEPKFRPEKQVRSDDRPESPANGIPAALELLDMTDDPSAQVRFQLALTLGEMKREAASEALVRLTKRDYQDRWIRSAILSSSYHHAARKIQPLIADSEFCNSDVGRDMLVELVRTVGGKNDEVEIRTVALVIESAALDENPGLKTSLIKGLLDGMRMSGASLRDLSDQVPVARQWAGRLIEDALKTLSKREASLSNRIQAIESLVHGDFEQVRHGFSISLAPQQPPAIQLATIRALKTFPDEHSARLIMERWDSLTPVTRVEAIEAMLGRPSWTAELADGLMDGQVNPRFLTPLDQQRILESVDQATRQTLVSKMSVNRPDQSEVMQTYTRHLRGSPTRGRDVFEKHCATCHRFANVGHEVGPDLAAIQNRTAESLLQEILEPNRTIAGNYTNYIVQLADGRVATGMIARETPNQIILQRAEGVTEAISRNEIEHLKSTGKSLMPEGIDTLISPAQMGDLISFLLQ